MSEDSWGIIWVPPYLPDSLANCNSWVEGGTSEVIDRDEGPEDKADRRKTPETNVYWLCVFAGDVQDEKDEDKGANHLHVHGGPRQSKI